MAQTLASIGIYVAHGASGIIERDGETVLKRPFPNNDSSRQEHLGLHHCIVRMLSWDYEQDILKLEYMRNGNLKSYLDSNYCSVENKIRWVKQAADAFQLIERGNPGLYSAKGIPSQFLHSKSVIHCNIKPDNFLLDEDLHLKISDFAGSSLSGSRALVCGSSRFLRPTMPGTPCEVQDDIFGLGSTIYTIITGTEPFGELESAEVEARFWAAEFPDTSDVLFGDVIRSCWSGRASIEQVCSYIETSVRQMRESEQL
ncbi:hypothetical protein E4T42_09399 [Aureobasidium subglaciale]|nr:hypothetical protein E4T42_09399 [Aureobasidium subglaciale]